MSDTSVQAPAEPVAEAPVEPESAFEVSGLLSDLDSVASKFHAIFDGKLPDPGRATQFDAFLGTVKMAVGHASDEATNNPVKEV